MFAMACSIDQNSKCSLNLANVSFFAANQMEKFHEKKSFVPGQQTCMYDVQRCILQRPVTICNMNFLYVHIQLLSFNIELN